MLIPSYLTSPLPGSHLVTDDRGLPVYQTDVPVTFTVSQWTSLTTGYGCWFVFFSCQWRCWCLAVLPMVLSTQHWECSMATGCLVTRSVFSDALPRPLFPPPPPSFSLLSLFSSFSLFLSSFSLSLSSFSLFLSHPFSPPLPYLSPSLPCQQSEVETGYLQEVADRYGYVMFACNWWGMDSSDVPLIVETIILNISNFRIVPDRLHQGMLNALSLMRLMKVFVCTFVRVLLLLLLFCCFVALFIDLVIVKELYVSPLFLPINLANNNKWYFIVCVCVYFLKCFIFSFVFHLRNLKNENIHTFCLFFVASNLLSITTQSPVFMLLLSSNYLWRQGSLYKDPLLIFDGRQVVDTESLHYYGNSLGGILGDVYMAVTTDVIRGQFLLLFPGTTVASVLLFYTTRSFWYILQTKVQHLHEIHSKNSAEVHFVWLSIHTKKGNFIYNAKSDVKYLFWG